MKTKLIGAVSLTLLFAAGGLVAATVVQDDDSQPQRRWRARTARQYPDDELSVRTVAATDDPPRLSSPSSIDVESPSNLPAKRAKPRAAGVAADSATDPAPEMLPPPRGARARVPSVNRETEVGPRSTMEQGEIFEDGQEDEGDFGAWVPDMHSMARGHLWFRGEALLWWLKGGQTPPLLTTSPTSTSQSQAGVLGQPGTEILFGDEELNPGLHAGARISFGTWLGCCEENGIEASYTLLGQSSQTYDAASMGDPILARPFFNTSTGAEDSHIIAYPNDSSGTFSASSTENYQGAEIHWRRALVAPGRDGRIDLLLGYRYSRLTDGLEIDDHATSSGATIEAHDSFHTQNNFNGGDIGFSTQWRRGRWSFDTLLKMGIGATQSQVVIKGSTAVISDGTTTNYEGGLLALPSNMGTHDSSQFSVMPEIGFTLACDLTQRLRASVGYTLLYWSNVARPGDQIDLNVDANQFPGQGQQSGEKPAFALHTSDFWAQGINLGLDYRF